MKIRDTIAVPVSVPTGRAHKGGFGFLLTSLCFLVIGLFPLCLGISTYSKQSGKAESWGKSHPFYAIEKQKLIEIEKESKGEIMIGVCFIVASIIFLVLYIKAPHRYETTQGYEFRGR